MAKLGWKVEAKASASQLPVSLNSALPRLETTELHFSLQSLCDYLTGSLWVFLSPSPGKEQYVFMKAIFSSPPLLYLSPTFHLCLFN